MPRKSKIKKLPQDIQDLIDQLLRSGTSISAVTAKLKELEVDVSRSAVGRYAKDFHEVIDRFNEVKVYAEALGMQAEDKTQGELTRANTLLLQGSLFKMLMGDGEKEVVLDPKEAMQLARSIESLAKTSKLDLERETKIRAEAEKRAKEEAAKAIDKVAKTQGLTKDTISAIKSQILGVS